jgi:hypothetical protein
MGYVHLHKGFSCGLYSQGLWCREHHTIKGAELLWGCVLTLQCSQSNVPHLEF